MRRSSSFRWTPRLRRAAASVAIGAGVFACFAAVAWWWFHIYALLRYVSAVTGVHA